MYASTFKFTPRDVDCRFCTEYIKKLGCIALSCPCLTERMQAGTVGYEEAAAEILPAGSVLIPRVLHLGQAFPGTMWRDAQHQIRMSSARAILGFCGKRDTPRFLAALYLLTSNRDLCARTFNCFFKDRIDFRYARRHGISEHDYTLLMAAKGLYCGTQEVTQADLADPYIIDNEAFRLIINALLIVRFGADVLKITQRYGQYEYHAAQKIRRGTGIYAPFAELFSPSETR